MGTATGDLFGCVHAHDDIRGCGFGPGCPQCPLRTAARQTLQTGEPVQRLAMHPEVAGEEERCRPTLLVSTARIDVEGRPHLLVCLEDVSNLKLAEDHVRRQAALLDQTQDAVLALDLAQRLRYANRSAERLHGRSAAQLAGAPIQELLFRDEPARAHEAFERTLQQDRWSGEIRQAAGARPAQVLESRWTLVRDAAGQPESILIVNTDLTEKKRLEAQVLRVQRMESIGTLASGVAHDLNNILLPIMIAVDLLRERLKGPDDETLLGMLSSSARRGAGIIRQLLTFGRGIDGERRELRRAPCSKRWPR